MVLSQIVFNGNNIDLLKQYPDNHFDSIVTDPPYGLGKEPIAEELMKDWIEKGVHEISGKGFMGKEWDSFVPQPIFWKEVFRVLKPGGHILAFYGTRTYDWGVMAMRFAGFEVRDCIQWLYGSGFPKSHNISKALDKMEGAEREVIGKQWDGWGTALKPANEPIVLARKPLEKGLSIAENILKWGVGGINIDASRIGLSKGDDSRLGGNGSWKTDKAAENVYEGGYEGKDIASSPLGRFPANIILTHSNYQVMNLVGNIDSSKLAEIIRYFYGYTKVFDLREGKRSTAIKDKCGDEILQFGVQEEITKKGFDTKQDSSELPQLSNTIHNIQEPLSNGKKEILQSNVQRPISEINEGGEGDKIWQKAHNRVEEENGGNENKEWNEFIEGETPKLEGGKNESSRICEYNDFNTSDGLARNSEENATKSNIHFGASDSNGDGNEKTAIGFGECTPHKRDKERQQSKQFSDRGQSETLEEASGNRCGNGKIEKGEPILEVLDFDVPTEWLRYFEYTGENLGCVCKGTKKVKGQKDKPTNRTKFEGTWNEGNTGLRNNTNLSKEGFADADGNEEIENWDCHEDCPIRILDEQSGDRSSTRINNVNDKIKKANTNKLFGGSIQKIESYSKDYRDKGGASRFFKTFSQDDIHYCYLCGKANKNELWKNNYNNVLNAVSNLKSTSQTKEPIVQENVTEILRKKADQIVKNVANLCDLCVTNFVQEVVEINNLDSKKEQFTLMQDFIQDCRKCTLLQNLVCYVEMMDNIDTTPITQNLLKLFGYAWTAIENYINKDIKEVEAQKLGLTRFQYQAKASKSERNKGLEEFDTKQTQGGGGGIGDYEDDVNSASGKYGSEKAPNKNFHPTVKPIKLMQYLVKMITPPNGIVLDPFCGSGTTGVACKLDGFEFVGLEQDPEYCKIAQARIDNFIEKKNDNQQDNEHTIEETINNKEKEQLKLWD